MSNSVSAEHDKLAESVVNFLTSPDFLIFETDPQPVNAGQNFQLNHQFANNSDDGFSNVVSEITELGPFQAVSANPFIIGNVGASVAGFDNFELVAPFGTVGGSYEITVQLRGELLGETYVSEITESILIQPLAF